MRTRRPMPNKRVHIGMAVLSRHYGKLNEPPIHRCERILRTSQRTSCRWLLRQLTTISVQEIFHSRSSSRLIRPEVDVHEARAPADQKSWEPSVSWGGETAGGRRLRCLPTKATCRSLRQLQEELRPARARLSLAKNPRVKQAPGRAQRDDHGVATTRGKAH